MVREPEQAPTKLRIGGINHLAITVDDLDQTLEDLRTNGVEVISKPRNMPNGEGDRFAFIHDNEGMLIDEKPLPKARLISERYRSQLEAGLFLPETACGRHGHSDAAPTPT